MRLFVDVDHVVMSEAPLRNGDRATEPRSLGRDDGTAVDVIGLGVRLAGGCRVAELAADHGVSLTTVYSWLKSAGLPTPAELGGSVQDRLRRRLRVEGDCLVWTGGTTPQGHPELSVGGRKQSVSHLRLAWAGRAGGGGAGGGEVCLRPNPVCAPSSSGVGVGRGYPVANRGGRRHGGRGPALELPVDLGRR